MALPQAARDCIVEAETLETSGDVGGALELYNEGLGIAMKELPQRPELKPLLEAYLRRAMALQPGTAGTPPNTAGARPPERSPDDSTASWSVRDENGQTIAATSSSSDSRAAAVKLQAAEDQV